MLRDLRHAFRTLARAAGYTATVVLTLALGRTLEASDFAPGA